MKGQMSINRVSSNPSFIRLEIEDDVSGTRFLQVGISLENFARMLTGSNYLDCDFELHTQNVGRTRESKTEIVPLEDKYFATDEQRHKALAPFEVDGWKARSDDISNHHNYTDKGIRVVFTRFV